MPNVYVTTTIKSADEKRLVALCNDDCPTKYRMSRKALLKGISVLENERKNVIGNTDGAKPEARRENREVNGNRAKVERRTIQINGETVIDDLAEA